MQSTKQASRWMSVILLGGLGITLMGCANSRLQVYSEVGKALPVAKYEVLGQTKYDQIWIDKTIEGEVAGFGFPRPTRRPASLAPKKPKPCPVCAKPVSVEKPPAPTTLPPEPPKKKRLLDRLKEKLKR